MKKSVFLGYSTLAIALLSSQGARAIFVAAPCDPNISGDVVSPIGLRSCEHYFKGNDPLIMQPMNPTDPPIPDPGMLALFKKKFKTQIEALYGRYPDLPPPGSPAGAAAIVSDHASGGIMFDSDSITNPPGVAFGPFGPQVCNIVGIGSGSGDPLTPTSIAPEISTSGIGARSCGTALQFDVQPNIITNVRDSATHPSQNTCGCLKPGTNDPVTDTNGNPVSGITPTQVGPYTYQPLDSHGVPRVDPTTGAPIIYCNGTSDPPRCSKPGSGNWLWYTCITGVEPEATLNFANSGTQEKSFLQGAYGSALSCFYTAKASEIPVGQQGQPGLEVEDIPYGGTTGPSECLAQTKQYKYLQAATVNGLSSLATALKSKGLGGTTQFADIMSCKLSWHNSSDSPTLNDPKISSLRQQAQHLCAMRADMEEAFYRLSVCQTMALAQAAYYNVIVDNLTKYWKDTLQDKVGEPCARYCEAFMQSPPMFNVTNAQAKTPHGLSGVMGAVFDGLKCELCIVCDDDIPFCHCNRHKVDGWCDESNKCPLQSPYESRVDFENEAGPPWPFTPARTADPARDDIQTCVNSCYKYGVNSSGSIVGPAGAVSTPTHPGRSAVAYNLPPGTKDSDGNSLVPIVKYTDRIYEYLVKQWPQNAVSSVGQCALGAPK